MFNRVLDTQQISYLALNIELEKMCSKFRAVMGISIDDFIKLYTAGIIKIDNLNDLNLAINKYEYHVDTLINIYSYNKINRLSDLKWENKWYKRLYHKLKLWIRLKVSKIKKRDY